MSDQTEAKPFELKAELRYWADRISTVNDGRHTHVVIKYLREAADAINAVEAQIKELEYKIFTQDRELANKQCIQCGASLKESSATFTYRDGSQRTRTEWRCLECDEHDTATEAEIARLTTQLATAERRIVQLENFSSRWQGRAEAAERGVEALSAQIGIYEEALKKMRDALERCQVHSNPTIISRIIAEALASPDPLPGATQGDRSC